MAAGTVLAETGVDRYCMVVAVCSVEAVDMVLVEDYSTAEVDMILDS